MDAPLTLDQLKTAIRQGAVDTVLLAMTDMQGRVQGKRMHARFFLDEVVEHGAEACNYLLAVDVDMNTVGGYEMSSWERGYGDFEMRPDFRTLRSIPWLEGTALCLADATAAGSAALAAVGAGLLGSVGDIADLVPTISHIEPQRDGDWRAAEHSAWKRFVELSVQL